MPHGNSISDAFATVMIFANCQNRTACMVFGANFDTLNATLNATLILTSYHISYTITHHVLNTVKGNFN